MEKRNDFNKPMQVFIGSMLGDGTIFLSSGKYLNYSEIHSSKQKEYLLWKLSIMSKLFNFANSPYEFSTYDKRTKKDYHHVKINTSDTKNLKKYYEEFYKNKKKIVPKEFLYKLNEMGLAVWYQDDGTYNYCNCNCSLSTDSFSYEEHALIQKFLKEKYHLLCKIYKKGNHFYLGFNRKETEKFLKLIKPHICKSMIYKLGSLDKSNETKLEEANKKAKKRTRNYYTSHKGGLINYQKKYRKNNPEKIKQQNSSYYLRNKEKVKTQNQNYYCENKKEILKRNRDYWDKNKGFLNKKKRLKRLKIK